ncbi:MAG TPA: SDR family oxidoreductase [candidate division Zixibacteria bacterium]|nr:SDR family oxidoreductase [candidate division Zixibacteria bacterium]HEQ99922.1 SDR family oxidoreductase [candidate division Zixibacteria bacterium]
MANSPQKLLLTGAAGFLGQALLKKFHAHYDMAAVINRTEIDDPPDGVEIVRTDLSEKKAVNELVRTQEPDIIVNTAAWVDVDGCESDRKRALKSNFSIVENLINAIKDSRIYFIQLSTDYIFNGVDHPANVDDGPAPLNYYGRTKLMAEEYITDNYARYLIARTCALFGMPNRGQTNLINYFYDSLKAGKEVQAPEDMYANPIWVENLAELLLEAIQKGYKGMLHLGGKDYLSRYEFARIFARIFGFDKDLVKPIAAIYHKRPARRPRYAGLNVEQTHEKLDIPLLSADEALSAIHDRMK